MTNFSNSFEHLQNAFPSLDEKEDVVLSDKAIDNTFIIDMCDLLEYKES